MFRVNRQIAQIISSEFQPSGRDRIDHTDTVNSTDLRYLIAALTKKRVHNIESNLQ